MADEPIDEVRRRKKEIRVLALKRRAEQPDAESLSRQIFEQIQALAEYVKARTLMTYLDFQTEVRTQWFVPTAWAQRKRVVVPYCDGDQLGLFRLDRTDELAPGTMGILEPRAELRTLADRRIEPAECDLIIVPGVAFDRRGGRLGYGKGYYDRLLRQVRSDAMKLAVCFECQLFAAIPALPHDIRMDLVVTEQAIYYTNAT